MYLEQAFNQIFQENKTTQEFKIHKVSTRKVQIKIDEVGAKNSLKLEFVLHFSFWRDFDQIFLGKSTCITARTDCINWRTTDQVSRVQQV